jgi:hypothetical protein
MSDTEYNSNMETIEGGEGAVYGGSNSGAFVTALKTNEPTATSTVNSAKIDNIEYTDKTIQFGITGIASDIDANIKWINLLNGIFKSAVKVTESGISKYIFTLNEYNAIAKKVIEDKKAGYNLNSESKPFGQKNDLKQAMQRILNHVGGKDEYAAESALSEATPAAPSGGSIDFVHPRFEMSLNTFGSLALYNKKKIDNNNKIITDITRTEGADVNTKPLLQITRNALPETNPDITEEMKTLFKDYLTFFNFVITLLTHNKLFTGDDNLKTFLTGKIYHPVNTTAFWPLLRILGQNKIEKPPRMSLYKPDTKDWVHTGMKKGDNGWKYVNGLAEDNKDPDSGSAELESGFTLIMDVLKGVEAMNTATNTMKVEIDLKEVCKLLAMLTQQHAAKGVKQKLVDALLKIVNETAKTAAENATEYKAFLNDVYGGVLDHLIDNVKDEKEEEGTQLTRETLKKELGKVADDLNAVADDLNAVAGDLNAVAGDLNAKPEAAAEKAKEAKEAAAAAAEIAEIAATKEAATEEDLTKSLQTAKEALETANKALETANKALDEAKTALGVQGGQKSKTLKRKQQQKNKSQRRFAYGGRKAYDQRKKQRQQKQN